MLSARRRITSSARQRITSSCGGWRAAPPFGSRVASLVIYIIYIDRMCIHFVIIGSSIPTVPARSTPQLPGLRETTFPKKSEHFLEENRNFFETFSKLFEPIFEKNRQKLRKKPPSGLEPKPKNPRRPRAPFAACYSLFFLITLGRAAQCWSDEKSKNLRQKASLAYSVWRIYFQHWAARFFLAFCFFLFNAFVFVFCGGVDGK